MTNRNYKKQVALLLDVLPEVAKEECFALHGGTAINLFVRDMPRVSVDIDLTYVPIEDRQTSLKNISEALVRIKENVRRLKPDLQIQHKEDIGKLLISGQRTGIKLEVNLVGRGTLHPPEIMPLTGKAQDEFDVFCEMPVIPIEQLYGGKICAALDRQHPRDLFDVKYLLENEGFTEEIKKGFLLCLLSGDRPIHETINPNLLDQRQAMENQFEGMSREDFSYADFEATRDTLISTIHENLTEQDRGFLLGAKNLDPDWDIYDFARFPAIQWKMQNLRRLKENNPSKHQEQYRLLRDYLYQ
ncbi:Ync [hydrothermal vent metagenome]|uniref:Ync n=1 Tax=hydrothermal vent metagenome TaxID=652676 RepID=A0A3B1BI13_9ZZZZ